MVIQDMFNDRKDRFTKGFVHYTLWCLIILNTVVVPITLSFMIDLGKATQTMKETGMICLTTGTVFLLYRIGIIAINDIRGNKK